MTGSYKKLTPDIGKAIAERLRRGLTRSAAAEASGVSYSSAFKNWLKLGRAEDAEELYKSFAEAVDLAEAEFEEHCCTILDEVATGYKRVTHKKTTRSVMATEKRTLKNGQIVETQKPIKVHDEETITSFERDPKYALEWLKRRRSADWSEKVIQEHQGTGGGPIQITTIEAVKPDGNRPDGDNAGG